MNLSTKETTLSTTIRIEKILIKPTSGLVKFTTLALSIISATLIPACKSTNPQTAKLKSAEETQNEIKSEITDLLIKPAQNFLLLVEPIANQFRSIQQLKAAADGAITQADTWARRELESARTRHRENALLWDIAKIFAGPDGLFNYQDVKNTFACMPDDELKGSILFALNAEAQNSSGYTKDALTLLSQHVRSNLPLPPFRSSFNPFGFLNAQQRPNEIRNEIKRHISRIFGEQCAIPKDQIHKFSVFDLIKTRCVQALEWRSQGILAGLLNLHYETASIDKPTSCEGRVLTQSLFQNFYAKYIAKKGSNRTTATATQKTAADFARLQTAKYFGPFETPNKSIQLYEADEDHFVNHYLNFPAGVQVTLRGGLPVSTVKTLMDDFEAGRNNLLMGDLGNIGRIFKTNSKCRALSSRMIPRKVSQPEQLDTTYYKNDIEFRAYFDPNYSAEQYFKNTIQDRDRLRSALEESRSNKSNAVLRKQETNGKTKFLHQSFNGINFFGSSGGTLTRSLFSKLSDGRVRLDYLYLEQSLDGEFSVTIQRKDANDEFELVDYFGYAIPHSVSNQSLTTPCLEFAAINK